MTPEADLVNGYKISRSDPLHRIIIGRTYHYIVSMLFGLKLRDVDCDFRLMRRSIFDRINLEKTSGIICVEMMKKIQDAGFRSSKCRCTTTTARSARRSSSTSGVCSGRRAICCCCGTRSSSAASICARA